ncbi:MAG: hypothetical protein U5K30_05975 [Acidimicrobiales bacterium]|nr:hypothetical protein [Acidimicrobiales bacterium]
MTDVDRRATVVLPESRTSGKDQHHSHDPGADTGRGPGRWGDRVPSPTRLALLCGLLYLPFIGLGYGTDIDITNILRSGESILAGDYRYSRPPGAFPYELLVGGLDRIGGPALVNLASAAAAIAGLVSLARIVERNHGARAGRIAVIVVATQPWFWVAATSLGDYLFALALLLVGIDAAQRDARIAAGLAFGLAVGFRSTTCLLVAAYLLAEVTGRSVRHPDGTGDRKWRDAFVTGVGAAVVGAAMFVPPWLSVGQTTQFLDNQLRTGDVLVMLARWGVKNAAFFGVIAIVLLLVRAPVLFAGLDRFRSLVMVRFAVFGGLVTELLFLRFPWKPVHLLPMAVCVAILLAVSPRTSNRLVAGVVASQLALAVVSVSIAEPDVADAATDGQFAPGLTRGVVVNDIDCRLDPPFAGDWPDLSTPEADFAAVDLFACQARSWRAGEGPSPLPDDS